MSFIEKKSYLSYILTIYVKPNSQTQNIKQDGKFLAISLTSKARKNKANKELIKLLQKQLNINFNQIRFISGLHSANKVIQIDFYDEIDENEIVQKLLH